VRAAKAIVLVTHDMNWVTEFCNRAMLLEKGHVVTEGAPAGVVKIHIEHSREARARKAAEIAAVGGAPTGRSGSPGRAGRPPSRRAVPDRGPSPRRRRRPAGPGAGRRA